MPVDRLPDTSMKIIGYDQDDRLIVNMSRTEFANILGAKRTSELNSSLQNDKEYEASSIFAEINKLNSYDFREKLSTTVAYFENTRKALEELVKNVNTALPEIVLQASPNTDMEKDRTFRKITVDLPTTKYEIT